MTIDNLPARYLITPEPTGKHFYYQLERCLDAGLRLVQFRAKQMDRRAYLQHAEKTLALCERYQAKLLLNAGPRMVRAVGAHGMHLSSARLLAQADRSLDDRCLIAASCHSSAELSHAEKINVDFAVLSPVCRTGSHPEARPLGWEKFSRLTRKINCPVYALGGMEEKHLPTAWAHGAQGIAAISGLWLMVNG
ncbi:MAG: thiamine phosphate synthase [Gammaproteobacteria bacterium]|nr:thiamine phosphate synthase [Gammaproteobacteria bacterium]